jgi:hypothetical protein
MANSFVIMATAALDIAYCPRSGAAMTAFEEDMNTTERALSGKSPLAASIFSQAAWVKKALGVFTAQVMTLGEDIE